MLIFGLVVAILALMACWFPFAGYAGLLAVGLGAIGRKIRGRSSTLFTVTVVLGIIACVPAVLWSVFFAMNPHSCPRVYAFDGQGYRLEADMVSGSLFQGAESDDLVRMDQLVAVNGEYRIRIANDLDERDFVDRVELQVVDHASGQIALPASRGEVAVLNTLRPAVAARDAHGRDLSAALARAEGQGWQGWAADHDPNAEFLPQDVVELTLPRPAEPGAPFLVVRARNTQVATDLSSKYLARMGPGLGTLLHWAEESQSYPYRQRLADEFERMGMYLRIEVQTPEGWRTLEKLAPVGPAVLRTQAVALPPELGDTVKVRLSITPEAWEIDQVAIGASAPPEASRTVSAVRAVDGAGRDLLSRLARPDGDRVRLDKGQYVNLVFPGQAPPAAGKGRSVLVRLKGYYEFDIGGNGWLDPVAIYRHRRGIDNGPRFMVRELRGE